MGSSAYADPALVAGPPAAGCVAPRGKATRFRELHVNTAGD